MAEARATAARIAAERGLQLTELRAQVFEIILRQHRPVGAYDVLSALAQARGQGRGRVAPTTVYRTLDFLLSAGLIHRIDSLNAYVACFAPGGAHPAAFLICETCGTVKEAPSSGLRTEAERTARASGFAVTRSVLEILGQCARCSAATQATTPPSRA